MISSRKLLAAAALAGFGLALTLSVTSIAGSARANAVADAGLAAKGDLGLDARCRGQIWPDIAPSCLTAVDGEHASPVRTVTFGRQIGDAATVLIRFPQPQVAAR
jgi:hypothetical protein